MGYPSTPGELVALLAPVVAGAGFDLEDVQVSTAGRRRLLRVIVDGDSGVSLDDIATISRDVSDALDAADALGGTPYVLEVTSPGVDRPLTEPRHWRRTIGRLVTVPLTEQTSLTGRLLAADETCLTLDVDGHKREITYAELPPGAAGRVQVEFRREEGER
jgi:ribosome maturation factor RimP